MLMITTTRWVRIRDLPGMSETAVRFVIEHMDVTCGDAELTAVGCERFLKAVEAVQGLSSAAAMRDVLERHDYPKIALEHP